MHEVLSETPGLGQVATCPNCEDIHVAVGRAVFRLPREMFLAVAELLRSAARHPALRGGAAPERFAVSFDEGLPRFKPLKSGGAS